MALTVTATQGGSTTNGILLRVFVLTGAKPSASQTGNSNSTQFSSTQSWTASLTNSANSSVYGAATVEQTTNAPAASNCTIVDDATVSTNQEVTFHATGLSAGTTSRGFTFTLAASTGPFVMLEILAAATLAEDGSAPAVVSTGSATTIATASFTPPSGSLLVALVASNGGSTVTTMTVSGGGLTWTESVKNNPSNGRYAGIWIADVPPPAAPNREPPLIPQSRLPRRAIIRSITGLPPPAAPNKEPPPGPRPRPPRRAVIQHITGTIPVFGKAPREPLQPQRARPPQRAVIRNITGTSPAAIQAYRPQQIRPAPRRPARAIVLSVRPQPAAAAAAVPSGFQDRRPGYLKKRILFGV